MSYQVKNIPDEILAALDQDWAEMDAVPEQGKKFSLVGMQISEVIRTTESNPNVRRSLGVPSAFILPELIERRVDIQVRVYTEHRR